MALSNGVHNLPAVQVTALLQQLGATLMQNTRLGAVYVSKKTNQTLTISKGQGSTLRVQVVGGCTC